MQVTNAAAAVQFGDMILTEPVLVAGRLSGGDLTTRLNKFLNRDRWSRTRPNGAQP